MRWMRYVSGNIRFVWSYPLANFGHVQNFKRTPPDKNVRWMNVTRALVCGLSGSRAVCPFLMRSASCRCPVCIRYWPFDLNCDRSTTGQVTEFPRQVPHGHSVFVQRTFCPFLIPYGTYSFCPLYIRYRYVSWPFFVWYFSVCALYDFRDDLHHHRDDFNHRINFVLAFFCPFVVRYLYPLCHSTISLRHFVSLTMRWSSKFCLRGPTFFSFFNLWRGPKDPSVTKSGQSSIRMRNAIFAGGSAVAQHCSFVVFHEIWNSIAKKTIALWFFQ